MRIFLTGGSGFIGKNIIEALGDRYHIRPRRNKHPDRCYRPMAGFRDSHDGLDEKIAAVLATPGPIVCDIRLQHDYTFEPKLSSEKKPDGRMISKPLEDLFPFLDRDEFHSNLLIQPWSENDKPELTGGKTR